jgi:hypothetical protein
VAKFNSDRRYCLILHLGPALDEFGLQTVIVGMQAILHGRWGVVPASEHQEILAALASLIRAQRYEMALTILDNELGI